MIEWFPSRNSFCCSHSSAFGLPWWLSSKESTCSAEDTRDTGSIPEWGRSPGEGLSNLSSVLAWRISWSGECGGQQSMGLQRAGHN